MNRKVLGEAMIYGEISFAVERPLCLRISNLLLIAEHQQRIQLEAIAVDACRAQRGILKSSHSPSEGYKSLSVLGKIAGSSPLR